MLLVADFAISKARATAFSWPPKDQENADVRVMTSFDIMPNHIENSPREALSLD